MLKIRLQRTGKKHDAGYRIVVAEKTSPIKWKFVEKIWSFMARKKEATLILDIERAKYWIWVWAQASDSVARLLFSKWLAEAEKFIEKRVMKTSKVELEAKQKEADEKQASIVAAEEKAAEETKVEEVKEELNEEAA